MDPDTAEDKATCFLDIPKNDTKTDSKNFSRWGWSNGPYMLSDFEGEGITLELWRAAGQCDLSKGNLVGHVQITRSTNTLHFKITMEEDWCLCDDVATYIGTDQVPRMEDGTGTVAPGQLPCKINVDFRTCQTLEFDYCEDVPTSEGIYILLHSGAASTNDI